MADTKGIIKAVRERMVQEGLDAYIVPFTDPHQSEYIPAHFKFREWISGFTGSAGVVVITLDFAGLWTDSRYFLQAGEQLRGSGIELVRLNVPHTPEYIDWLIDALSPGSKAALDGRFFPASLLRSFTGLLGASGIELVTNSDLLSTLWNNLPPLPGRPIEEYPLEYAGTDRSQKIALVRQELAAKQADYLFIAPLDEIAWLFNLRGSDVDFSPVFVAFAVIGLEEALLFAEITAITDTLRDKLTQEGVTLRSYSDLYPWLESLPQGFSFLLAPEKTTGAAYSLIASKARILEGMNPTTFLKAIRNETEIEALKAVMIKDGIAWVNTLCWIDQCIRTGEPLTELSVARQIAANRARQNGYRGESFHPISSYHHHGAVVHYSVTEESSIPLQPHGIYLLDSGGQFLGGTTDTTRTITLGKPTREQQADFTLALKGTLGVSMLRFPKGTRGYQIDVLARNALWQAGKNYGHGTGHGVGSYLNVHEGPQSMGTSASGYLQVTLDPGMILTIEPAVYVEGEYGMRTENMLLIIPDSETSYGTFYRFETLTWVPIDRNLIDVTLLSPAEKSWIDGYHQAVWETLAQELDGDVREWLRRATLPLTQ